MWKNIWLKTDQSKVKKSFIFTADNQARQPVASQVFEDVAAAQVGHYLYHLLKWPTKGFWRHNGSLWLYFTQQEYEQGEVVYFCDL